MQTLLRILRWLVGLPIESTLTDQERRIFVYWDGQRQRRVDPLLAWQSLANDSEFNIETHPAAADRGELDAVRISCQASRRAFDVKPLAEGGLTESECFNILVQFFEYCASLKKSIDRPPTSPAPTESPSSGTSITPPVSDSGLTASEPNAASVPG